MGTFSLLVVGKEVIFAKHFLLQTRKNFFFGHGVVPLVDMRASTDTCFVDDLGQDKCCNLSPPRLVEFLQFGFIFEMFSTLASMKGSEIGLDESRKEELW